MQLEPDTLPKGPCIDCYEPGCITVDKVPHRSSIMIVEKVGPIPLASIEDLTADMLNPILESKPDCLVLGTGEAYQPMAPALQAMLEQQGIGLELAMTRSAVRLYMAIFSDSRKVNGIFVV